MCAARSGATLAVAAAQTPCTMPRVSATAALLCAALCLPLASHADELADVQRMAQAGDTMGALQRAETALAAKPRDARLRFAKGVLLSDLKRDAEAITVFEQLSQDYPELPDPLNNLAVLYAAQGRLDDARIALESALRNDAQHRTARENLADVYVRMAIRLWASLAASAPADAAIARKLKLARELLAPPR
jgi:Flp pilus assembly protein TadD